MRRWPNYAATFPYCFAWWQLLWCSGGLLVSLQVACAQGTQAPVEVRVPLAPQPVAGSDGLVHVAYELHVTNYYQSTGTPEGLPFVFQAFERTGSATLGEALDQTIKVPATSALAKPCQQQLPLDGDVVVFK